MNRRTFLLASAILPLAAQPEKGPSVQFPTDPKQRLSVATYPFRSGFKSLPDFASSLRDQFGVSGLEPWSRHFQSTDTEYVRFLHEAFTQAGVHVVNIPADTHGDPCSSARDEREAAIQSHKRWVDAAVVLQSPGVRFHVPTTKARKADLQCATETLRTLAQYGASKGIVISLENDDPRSEDPFTIAQVITAVNSPYLRALPDFCNSMLISGDPQYNLRGLRALFKQAYSISHVKDAEVDNGTVYRVSLPEIFAIAKQAGYRGYFSMEFEGTGNPHEGTKALLAQSLKELSKAD